MSGVAHLFSGGVDSTLAASVLAERFEEVHLVTFVRAGFLSREKALSRLGRLRDRHPTARITHRFLDAGPFFEELSAGWGELRARGVLALAPCGVCKISMHWRLLLYCLENSLAYACDGAAPGAEEYAEQNPRILMGPVRDLYASFGVTKLSPAFEPGQDNEEELFRRGLSETRAVKRTPADEQILCSQQVLFAMAMRAYLSRRSFSDYEREQREYLTGKLRRVEELTRRHRQGGTPDRVRELLERSLRA